MTQLQAKPNRELVDLLCLFTLSATCRVPSQRKYEELLLTYYCVLRQLACSVLKVLMIFQKSETLYTYYCLVMKEMH